VTVPSTLRGQWAAMYRTARGDDRLRRRAAFGMIQESCGRPRDSIRVEVRRR
jgi:hypothetical protein